MSVFSSFKVRGIPVPPDCDEIPLDLLNELKKKNPKLNFKDIQLQTWEYGRVGQILHIGEYNKEQDTIARLKELILSQGFKVANDSHEEIYLSDPRKTVPQKNRTLLVYRIKAS